GTVVYFANFVADAGVEQDALTGSGFSGIDVSGNTNIAIALDGGFAGHDKCVLCLPTEVAEGLVGLGHLVRVLAFLHRGSTTFGGIEQFTGQAQIHRFFAALLGSFTQPAHGEGQAAHGAHFNRHLIVRATDTAAFHFDDRLDVVDGGVEDFQGFFASFRLDLLKGTIHDALGNSLLAGQHHNVHEFGEFYATEFWIGENLTFGDFATTRHFYSL